jgi:hypothetical protein
MRMADGTGGALVWAVYLTDQVNRRSSKQDDAGKLVAADQRPVPPRTDDASLAAARPSSRTCTRAASLLPP